MPISLFIFTDLEVISAVVPFAKDAASLSLMNYWGVSVRVKPDQLCNKADYVVTERNGILVSEKMQVA
jgi:hypothetical protein